MAIAASSIQCPVFDEQLSVQEGPCVQTSDPNDDFCAGMCEQTITMKCSGIRKQPNACTIAPRWSNWTPFTAKNPFDLSRAVELQAYAENSNLAPITVQCNPCGGPL